MPLWVKRAHRRRRLLELGVSLTEQANTPTFELDALLAVDDVANKVMTERQERTMDDVQHRR